MSKLTSILDELVTDQCSLDSGEYPGDASEAFSKEQAEQQIKDLMLETIGYTSEGRSNISANDLVFELRNKIKEL